MGLLAKVAWRPGLGRRGVLTLKKFTREATPEQAKSMAKSAAPSTVRLAKRIAMSGLCSRREAEKRIRSFDVTVNGRVTADVATTVDVANDVVSVDGRVLTRTQKVKVWMAHKIKGELVTNSDPQGRATIFDRLRVMGLTQHMMPV
ncbi:RNA pseudouridine synthase, partial [Phytophthora palmivora]